MKKFLMQVFIVFSLLLTIPINTSLTYQNAEETIYEINPISDQPSKNNENN